MEIDNDIRPDGTPDETVVITVRGTPRPQPRPRFVGKGRVVSTADAGTRAWAERVRGTVRKVMADRYGFSWKGYAGAVQVDLVFVLPIKDKKRHGEFCTAKPDTDNLAKLVMDAMERAGVFQVGDQQIVASAVSKVYGDEGEAGVCILVSPPRMDAVSGRLALIGRQDVVDRPDWLA